MATQAQEEQALVQAMEEKYGLFHDLNDLFHVCGVSYLNLCVYRLQYPESFSSRPDTSELHS
jgi:hypothetical protein